MSLSLRWLFCSKSLNKLPSSLSHVLHYNDLLAWSNSLKLRSINFGYVVHNDIPPSSHSTKALNLVTPSSIEILWQPVIKWENWPGPVLSSRFLLNLALLMKLSLCYPNSVLRWWSCYCKTWQDVQIMIIYNHSCNEVYKW